MGGVRGDVIGLPIGIAGSARQSLVAVDQERAAELAHGRLTRSYSLDGISAAGSLDGNPDATLFVGFAIGIAHACVLRCLASEADEMAARSDAELAAG
jgi:hypothetical protein